MCDRSFPVGSASRRATLNRSRSERAGLGIRDLPPSTPGRVSLYFPQHSIASRYLQSTWRQGQVSFVEGKISSRTMTEDKKRNERTTRLTRRDSHEACSGDDKTRTRVTCDRKTKEEDPRKKGAGGHIYYRPFHGYTRISLEARTETWLAQLPARCIRPRGERLFIHSFIPSAHVVKPGSAGGSRSHPQSHHPPKPSPS